MSLTKENTVLDDLYDRQTRTYGIDAVNYLKKGNVYIINPNFELSLEVIKNLVLTGIQNIFINNFDDIMFKIKKSFYIDMEKDNYIEQIINYITDLNPSINVNTFDNYSDIKSGSTVVITNQEYNNIISNNDLKLACNDCKMVFGWDNNYSGCVYTDAGDEHFINQQNDIIYESKKIDRVEESTIYVENHGFYENDIVTFNNMEGSYDFLIGKEFKIFNPKKDSFQIDITEPVKLVNGFVKKEHTPITVSHKRFWESEERQMMSFDIDKSNSIIDNLINTDYDNYCYPIISVIGGIISAEVVKLITFKYTPISQWFEFHDDNIKDIDITNLNQAETNILMVGCGALGCEWLKNLMMIGVKNIDVTDPDHIELSNLSRQFLFRNKDVKDSKSNVACKYIKNKDDSMNVRSFESKLCEDNMSVVNDLFESKNIIVNALDNLTARRFIDGVCYEKCIPLFESGTMGMKGNTQPVLPYLTETYSDSSDPPENNSYPVCTIKNFPNKIEHTIHWARDYFEIFNSAFRHIIKYRDDKQYFSSLSAYDKNLVIEYINMFCITPVDDWTDCLYIAKDIFDQNYMTEIKQLLYCYPKDHEVNGELFWSNGKRCPNIYSHYYSSNITNFLESTTKLLCNIYGINQKFTRDELMQLVLDFTVPDFVPDEGVKIAKNDKELKEMNKSTKENVLIENIYFKEHYFPQEFEKDDDSNWHVKWITSASNCRAEIYNIKCASEFTTKGIAGKIIPAVATTTSTIVGLISIELIKYMNKNNKVEDYNSYFVNLSDNTFIGADPMSARITKIGDKEFNQWEKLDFKANENSTINDFINYFNDKLEINIETICLNSSIIYSEMIGSDKNDNLISSIQEYTDDTTVQLILMDDKENEIPNIVIEIYVK